MFLFVEGATDLRCFMLIYFYFHDSRLPFVQIFLFVKLPSTYLLARMMSPLGDYL